MSAFLVASTPEEVMEKAFDSAFVMLFHFAPAVSRGSGLHVGFNVNLRLRHSVVFELARCLLRGRVIIEHSDYSLLLLFHPVLLITGFILKKNSPETLHDASHRNALP